MGTKTSVGRGVGITEGPLTQNFFFNVPATVSQNSRLIEVFVVHAGTA